MKAVINPENYCPVCGGPADADLVVHRCPPHALAAIDGAHRRTPEEETPPRPSLAARHTLAELFHAFIADGG